MLAVPLLLAERKNCNLVPLRFRCYFSSQSWHQSGSANTSFTAQFLCHTFVGAGYTAGCQKKKKSVNA
jgi:hypothetical protein